MSILIVLAWKSGESTEALLSTLVAILLFIIGTGLWRRRPWARRLALIVHWPALAAAFVGSVAAIIYLLKVPAKGIAFWHIAAVFAISLLLPLGLFSAWTLWYLHRRTQVIASNPVCAADESKGDKLDGHCEFTETTLHHLWR